MASSKTERRIKRLERVATSGKAPTFADFKAGRLNLSGMTFAAMYPGIEMPDTIELVPVSRNADGELVNGDPVPLWRRGEQIDSEG